MKVDMSPDAISDRLRRVGELSDLRADRRLDAKIGYSPEQISARLREVSELNRLCESLGKLIPK